MKLVTSLYRRCVTTLPMNFGRIVVLCLVLSVAESIKTVRRLLSDKSPVVGQIKSSGTGKEVEEYLGIPFAEPPVGELRFKKPVPKKKWSKDFEAFTLPVSCYQTSDTYFDDFVGATMWNSKTEISEDCLYLNIWAPVGETNRKLTVMIWIYGGGFWSGNSALDVYDGKIFAAEENVILVTMNYRVTAFGFLYLGTDDAPGNVGLWDQLEVFKWVKEHISNFGGNPDHVTIFGESAGAASVSFHVLSPESRNYFKRSMMQSGSATAPWALEPRQILIQRFLLLSEACGCNVTIRDREPDFKKAIYCLRNVSAEKIREREWITNEFCDFPWTPVVDGEFLVEHPKDSLKRKNFKQGEILVGSVYDESMYFVVYHVSNIFRKSIFFTEDEFITSDELFREAARQLLPEAFSSNKLVFDAIIHEYRDYHIPATPLRRQNAIDKMLGDYHFTCNVNEFADYVQLAGNNAYMYHFKHQSSLLPWPKWMGVLHGYEIPFVLGEPLNESYKYTEEEKVFTRKVMRYWANFGRTGDPNKNPDGSMTDGETWPVYTASNEEYMSLDTSNNHPKVGHGIRRRQCAFWKQYLPKLLTATNDLSQYEMRWKHQFDRWENDYIRDWQYQMERYARFQERAEEDAGSCDHR